MSFDVRRTSAKLAIFTLAAGSINLAGSARAQAPMAACHVMSKGNTIAPDALPAPQKMTDLGNLHFAISSKNPETQAWFDQGINLIYDFWDYEAERAFEQAVRTDPNCAICHWGLAEAYQFSGREDMGYMHEELQKAVALKSHADHREQMYIDVMVADEEAALNPTDTATKGKSPTDLLRKIVHKYPKDATAYLMLSEQLSDGYDDGKPGKGTEEGMRLLQQVLHDSPDNSAANHLWIHAVEASPHPEQALHSADLLGTVAPASGHMTHMPGHIFYRTGNYERAQVAFDLSESIDEAYMKAQHVDVDNDWNYVHNLMYSIANLMEAGRMTEAGVVSNKLVAARGQRAATLYPWSVRDSMTRLNPQLPIALRSGDWASAESLLTHASAPAEFPHLQTLNEALTAFVRGMHSAEQNQLDAAKQQSAVLDARLWRVSQQVEEDAAQKKKADGKKDTAQARSQTPQNQATPTDAAIEPLIKNLSIMSLELRAAILIRSGKTADAEPLLAQARRYEQNLGYHEPPAFIRPVAEQEAELMIASGDKARSEAAWKLALEDRPRSGFPLYGLAVLAEQSGDASRTTAAYREFLSAWKSADPELPQVKHAQQWMSAHAGLDAPLQPSTQVRGKYSRCMTEIQIRLAQGLRTSILDPASSTTTALAWSSPRSITCDADTAAAQAAATARTGFVSDPPIRPRVPAEVRSHTSRGPRPSVGQTSL